MLRGMSSGDDAEDDGAATGAAGSKNEVAVVHAQGAISVGAHPCHFCRHKHAGHELAVLDTSPAAGSLAMLHRGVHAVEHAQVSCDSCSDYQMQSWQTVSNSTHSSDRPAIDSIRRCKAARKTRA